MVGALLGPPIKRWIAPDDADVPTLVTKSIASGARIEVVPSAMRPGEGAVVEKTNAPVSRGAAVRATRTGDRARPPRVASMSAPVTSDGTFENPLGRAHIGDVMKRVQSRVASECHGTGQTEIAIMKIKVDEDGSVTAAELSGELAGTAMGSCVQEQVMAAEFSPSSGLRFDYRLSVR